MKTSEEMSKSVMEKVRAYEVHKAAVRKRVAAVSVTAAALAICLVAGAAASGNLHLGRAKSADNAVRDENYYGYAEGIDSEIDGTKSAETFRENSDRNAVEKAEEANGAEENTYLTYKEFNEILPENSPLKDLEDRGFEITECRAQLTAQMPSDIASCIYAFADFGKAQAQGTITCDFTFDGTLDEYMDSSPLSFPDQHKIQCGGIETVYSYDGEGGYVALLESGGVIYKINVGGVNSPEELQTVLSDLING